ncbi:MAG: hypothetical protein ACOX5R_01950 [bacterium]
MTTSTGKAEKIRFYSTPETEFYWQTALETGIDLINTDQLENLNAFLTKMEPSAVQEASGNG